MDQYQDTIEQQAPPVETDGWEWMLVEIMGHRTHWGRARQEERFGTKMLRIDVPNKGDPATHGWSTHYYGGASIFSFTLTDETTVMARNKPWEPPSRYSLPAPGTPDDADDGSDGLGFSDDVDHGDEEAA